MATVPYPKSWNSGEVLTAADLNAQFAAVANIGGLAGSQLATGAVAPAQMAVGAAVNQAVIAGVNVGLTVDNVERTIATLPTFTARGSRVVIFGTVAGKMSAIDTSPHTYTFRLYRGATLLASWQFTAPLAGPSLILGLMVPILWSEVPTAASSVIYTVKGITSDAPAAFITDTTSPGSIFAVELT